MTEHPTNAPQGATAQANSVKVSEAVIGRLAKRPYRDGDKLPDVRSLVLVSGANCDVESDQHRSFRWRQVIGYSDDKQFVCLQTPGCWPTVERMENCWFADDAPPEPAQ